MRILRALALISLVAVCACAAASGSAAAVPACKAGQTSTDADPCMTTVTCRCGVTKLPKLLNRSRGLFQLVVRNTDTIGYINTFTWTPPAGMQITAVTSGEGGKCKLRSGALACVAGKKGIAPPKPPVFLGGSMSVNFTLTGNNPFDNGTDVVGQFQITGMTPAPYKISYIQQTNPDWPYCGTDGTGDVSTKAKPCTPRITGN